MSTDPGPTSLVHATARKDCPSSAETTNPTSVPSIALAPPPPKLFRVWVRDGTGDEKLPTTGRVCEDHRRWAAWQDSQVVGSVAVGI
jgi:hypothetical protein